MDPEACLLAAETAIVDGEEDLAIDALENYVNWRGMGGYEPKIHIQYSCGDEFKYDGSLTGDYFHRDLIRRFELKFGPYLDARLP